MVILLTGRYVFDGTGHEEIVTAHLDREPEPLDPVAASAVPPGLVEIIHRLLAKDPARRPQSADELETALEALGTATPTGHVLTPALLGNDADYSAEQTLVMVKPRSTAV